MLQVKIFEPMERAALETAVNDYLAGFHQAASPRDLRISRVPRHETWDEWGDGAQAMYWATLTVESVRRDLAEDPTLPRQPRPTTPESIVKG